MTVTVMVSSTAKKQLNKVPIRIRETLAAWILSVELNGIQHVRRLPSYHDETLKGKRKGQRSIRLSLQWRAIYQETEANILLTIL